MASVRTKIKVEQLVKAYNEMYEALKYYKGGIAHFYKCINFSKSNLDAEAIQFMNDSEIKIAKAIILADKIGPVDTI